MTNETKDLFNICKEYSTYRLLILIELRGWLGIGLDETRIALL